MAGSAVVNAVGEELLWRGAYLDTFPEDVWRGAVWPWVGFTLWHLAPQIVFPSRHGRAGFLGGAALVGAASGRVAWTTRGLRWTLVPHILTEPAGSGRRCFGWAEPLTGHLRTDSTTSNHRSPGRRTQRPEGPCHQTQTRVRQVEAKVTGPRRCFG
jgi:hypothetical protein